MPRLANARASLAIVPAGFNSDASAIVPSPAEALPKKALRVQNGPIKSEMFATSYPLFSRQKND
jgi:hypothetical protein